jgi:hypothetical protein
VANNDISKWQLGGGTQLKAGTYIDIAYDISAGSPSRFAPWVFAAININDFTYANIEQDNNLWEIQGYPDIGPGNRSQRINLNGNWFTNVPPSMGAITGAPNDVLNFSYGGRNTFVEFLNGRAAPSKLYFAAIRISNGTISLIKIVEVSLVDIPETKPTLTASAAIVDAFAGQAIQEQSRFQITVNPTFKYGATLASVKIQGPGLDYTGTSLSVTSAKVNVTSGTYTITVTDTRGSSQSTTVNVSLLPYTSPSFLSVVSQRTNSTGQPVSDGLYATALATVTGTPIMQNGQNQNVLVGTLEYRAYDSSTWIQVEDGFTSGVIKLFGGELDIAKYYDVRYTISDAFNTVTYLDRISPAAYLLDFKRGGDGLAIGKEATETGLDVGWTAKFRENVTMLKNLAAVSISAVSLSLSNALSVPSGGTGRNTLPDGHVLVGNHTGAVGLVSYATLRDTAMGFRDYVIQESINMTNGAQSYRLWASGLLEIWYSSSATQAVQTAWGSIFRSANTYSAITYIKPFSGNPVVSASLRGAMGCWLCGDSSVGSATVSPVYRIASPLSTASFNAIFTLYAFGWAA